MNWSGLEGPLSAVVLGGRGGIGEAFVDALTASAAVDQVYATSRDEGWCAERPDDPKATRVPLELTDEGCVERLADRLREDGVTPRVIVNCTGLLHADGLRPERTWRELDAEAMGRAFAVNAIAPALAIKHLVPTMPRREAAIFATLSARVGSIGDNRLGGWYSYRASKAAQNMIVKTAAIEAATRHPKLRIVALHPGTVASDLSAPFTKRLAPGHAVFSPTQSCDYLCEVLAGLTVADSGGFFAWDGAPIPW
jgi:NAD(P)-dependent dehydrogenase (short-subunit alcohol dehydrogenase family)